MKIETIVQNLGELGLVWPDKTSAAAVLDGKFDRAAKRTWQRVLRAAYSRESLVVGYAIFGRALELEHLAKLQAVSSDWRVRIQNCPALAPLMAAFVKINPSSLVDFGAVRSGALARGLMPSAWKWLCRQHRSTVRELLQFGWSPEAIFWINLLARARSTVAAESRWLEAGRPYMFEPFYHYVAHADAARRHQLELMLERFFRIVPEQPSDEQMVQYELLAAAMAVGVQQPNWALTPQASSTWKGLYGHCRRINDERNAIAAAVRAAKEAGFSNENIVWNPIFGNLEHNGVKATELVSNFDLQQEGSALAHCVGDGDYLEGCLAGKHVIVSLAERHTGARATLQLRRSASRSWMIAQLAGHGNSRVPQLFWKTARALQQTLAN